MSHRFQIPGDSDGDISSASTPDDSLLMTQEQILKAVQNATPSQKDSENLQRFAGFGIGIGSLLTEKLLSYPFIVFRRQCQVNHHAHRYHLQPFSVIQVIISLQRQHGFMTMWKGIGSSFVLQGIHLGSEAILGEFTPFEKEVTSYSTIKQLGGHLILKALALVVTTPFLSASLVESVQSDIASDKPGVLDCVKEGFCRLSGWGTPKTTRLVPMHTLVVPTVAYGLLKYFISSVIQYSYLAVSRRNTREKSKDMMDAFFPELVASFFGNLTADVLLYPVELVIIRLHIQGTRTIIDNTDFGHGVVPVSTSYEGFVHCLQTVSSDEGSEGLFKGLGALILQYALHGAIIWLTRTIFERITEELMERRDK